MRLLAQRVPLTLLLDLLVPPDATELYAREGGRVATVPAQLAAPVPSTSAVTAARSTLPEGSIGSSSTSTS